MIRIVCFEADAGMAANVGGPVRVSHKTFDVKIPEVEAYLAEQGGFMQRGFVGIEVVKEASDDRT